MGNEEGYYGCPTVVAYGSSSTSILSHHLIYQSLIRKLNDSGCISILPSYS